MPENCLHYKGFFTISFYALLSSRVNVFWGGCRVASVEKYTDAVKVLFDPDNAQVDLLSLEIEVRL